MKMNIEGAKRAYRNLRYFSTSSSDPYRNISDLKHGMECFSHMLKFLRNCNYTPYFVQEDGNLARLQHLTFGRL